MTSNYIALIPAYEPGRCLIQLAEEFHRAGFTGIVVNDGSGGQFFEIFQAVSAYATVLHHELNMGKGCALKTGFAFIQEHYKGKTIVTVDADGQHSIKDALRVCRAAESNPGTLVLGSRTLKGNVPARSRLGNSITRFVYRISTGIPIHDTQTGLRGFSGTMLSELLSISGQRYEYEMNVLLEFSRRHIPMKEVEIETIYLDNNAASHFDTVRDSVRVYKEILRFSAASLISFFADYGLYSLLSLLTAQFPTAVGLRLSNMGARIVSAGINYTLNRRFVFKNSGAIVKSALQYILLAACILLGNTVVLEFSVNRLGINRFIAKLITEALFFILSWLVQRCIIFRRKEVLQ